MEPIQVIENSLIEQFGAAIEMLENTIRVCNEKQWKEPSNGVVIGQVIYHVSYFIDEHFCRSEDEVKTLQPKYGNLEMGEYINGLNWDGTLTQEDVLKYLTFLKSKVKKRFEELDFDELIKEPVFNWHGISFLSSFLYSLRHIMLHIGSLHVRLNPGLQEPLKWVSTGSLE